MVKFLDGPAQCVVLQLRRSPTFLRVVHDKNYEKWLCKKGRSEFDALDQLRDTPAAHETIYVYRLKQNFGTVHINSRDKNGRHNGGTFVRAEYALHAVQPPDDVLRDTAAWQAWAVAELAKEQVDESVNETK